MKSVQAAYALLIARTRTADAFDLPGADIMDHPTLIKIIVALAMSLPVDRRAEALQEHANALEAAKAALLALPADESH
jgi:hypothetical protein